MRPKIYTPKRDDEHPRPFHMGVPPPPSFSCYYSSMKQNDYVRMTFPENSSLQFIRTAPLSMVTLNTESQNPMDCLYVKSPGNQWVKLATFMGTPTSVLFRSSQRFWVFGYPGSFSFTYTVFWCHNMGIKSILFF